MSSEVFKIVNNIALVYIKDLINIKHSHYNFRRENQVSLPTVKSTMYGLKSFRFYAARIWNRPERLQDGRVLSSVHYSMLGMLSYANALHVLFRFYFMFSFCSTVY